MQITRDKSGRVVKISGTLDIGAASELKDALSELLAVDGAVALDISDVDGCDITGFQLFHAARKSVEISGRSWELVGLPDAVRTGGASIGLSMDAIVGSGANVLPIVSQSGEAA